MKIFKSVLTRTLLVVLILFGVTITVNILRGKPAAFATGCSNCGTVTDQQIITYMNAHGYTVYSITPISGSCDKRCDTQNCYDTKVIICDSRIVGHLDLPSDYCEVKNRGGDIKNI